MTSGGLVEELIDVETVESAGALARTLSPSSDPISVLHFEFIPNFQVGKLWLSKDQDPRWARPFGWHRCVATIDAALLC